MHVGLSGRAALAITMLALTGCRIPGVSDPSSGRASSASTIPSVRERVPVQDLASAVTPPACGCDPAPMADGVRRSAPGEVETVSLVPGADGDIWTLATTMTGQPDRIVRFSCTQGDVTRPEVIALYADAGAPVGSFDLGSAGYPQSYPPLAPTEAVVTSAALAADSVVVSWRTFQDTTREYAFWTGTLRLRDGALVIEGVHEQ